MENNQGLPPPPPPPLSIKLPSGESKKQDEYRLKLINKFEGFKGSTNDELTKKYEQVEDVNPDIMNECEGEGYHEKEINTEGKIQCQRCEGWFLKEQEDSHKNSHSAQILDWLFLGGERNANNMKELTVRTNISYILNTAREVLNYSPEHFTYLKLELYDNIQQDLLPFVEQGIDFIKKAKDNQKNILVHCIQGISRSTSFVLAYLMKYENYNLKDAFTLVKSKRSIANPNPRFVEFLLDYEKTIHGKNSCEPQDINPLSEYIQQDLRDYTYKQDREEEKD